MPTLEASVEQDDTTAIDAVQALAEPSSDESRRREFFTRDILQAFRTSQFLQVESHYQELRLSLAKHSKLRNDWNSYGAEKPSSHAIEAIVRLLSRLRNESFLPLTLVPSAEGGIAAYFKANDRVSYLEYRNSGEVILAMYDQHSEPDVRELSENDADESRAIALIREYITA